MHKTKLTAMLSVVLLFLFPAFGWTMIASNSSNVTLLDMEDQGIQLFLGASIDVENGDMTYIIQGSEDGGWKSELEWPLENIVYIGGVASVDFRRKFQVNAGIWTSVTDDAGKMKDSDWLFGFYGDQRVIYSETEATVDSTQFDVNLRYNFLSRETLSLGAILGYSYTKWDWKAGNGFQTTIDPFTFFQGPIEGIGITYEEKIQVPYLGLALSMFPLNSSFGFNVYTLYSPIAQCDDEDDHIQRFKLSTGETDGTFLSLGGDLRWKFTDSWSLTGRINYTSYDLEGEQNQSFYAGENAGIRFENIDLTVEGSQVYIGLMLGYEL